MGFSVHMEDTIQFIAKDNDWIVVKKLKPREQTPLNILIFLSGIEYSVGGRIEHYLGEVFDMGELNSVIEEVTGKATPENIANAIKTVNTKASRIIGKMVEGLDVTKKEKEALKALLKAYTMRRALRRLGLKVDYAEAYAIVSGSLPKK